MQAYRPRSLVPDVTALLDAALSTARSGRDTPVQFSSTLPKLSLACADAAYSSGHARRASDGMSVLRPQAIGSGNFPRETAQLLENVCGTVQKSSLSATHEGQSARLRRLMLRDPAPARKDSTGKSPTEQPSLFQALTGGLQSNTVPGSGQAKPAEVHSRLPSFSSGRSKHGSSGGPLVRSHSLLAYVERRSGPAADCSPGTVVTKLTGSFPAVAEGVADVEDVHADFSEVGDTHQTVMSADLARGSSCLNLTRSMMHLVDALGAEESCGSARPTCSRVEPTEGSLHGETSTVAGPAQEKLMVTLAEVDGRRGMQVGSKICMLNAYSFSCMQWRVWLTWRLIWSLLLVAVHL